MADAAVAELRRRLGSGYTVDELVDLYGCGTSWVLDLAYRVAPEAPWAWDERVVAARPSPATSAAPRTSPAAAASSPSSEHEGTVPSLTSG